MICFVQSRPPCGVLIQLGNRHGLISRIISSTFWNPFPIVQRPLPLGTGPTVPRSLSITTPLFLDCFFNFFPFPPLSVWATIFFPTFPPHPARGIIDIVAHLDALDGGKVDANLRAIRVNPGIIRGDPLAAEYHAPGQAPLATEGDASEDDVSPVSAAAEEDVPDFFPPPACQHKFFATWDSLATNIARVPAQTNTPTFRFVRDFLAVASHLLPERAGSTTVPRAHLAAEELQVQCLLLRQQVQQWRRRIAEQSQRFSPPSQVTCPRPVVQTSSSPALTSAANWLRTGCCTTPSGALNLKQAAFFLAFAVDLDVSWLPFVPSLTSFCFSKLI